MDIIILCGGSGSRLWPKSREMEPKQLLKLTNEYTLLQNTIIRVNKLLNRFLYKNHNNNNNIIIICNKKYMHIVDNQINQLKLDHMIKIIKEPIGRDSAPAICISVLISNNNNISIVVPSDHIFDDDEFINCCMKSSDYIENSIITFGIKPTRIETGFGYIKIDRVENINNSCYNTEKFIEKPNYENAKKYFESDSYLWNAGIFIFRNNNIIKCFEKYASDIIVNCRQSIESINITNSIIDIPYDLFSKCKSISMDYAIMELLCNENPESFDIKGITIPYTSYWNDIGSFSALHDILDKDNNMNVIKGDIITYNSSNCYVESLDKLTTLVGINNVIVVNTNDALLICNKDSTQDIKKIVEELKRTKRIEILQHSIIYKSWGWYNFIDNSSIFKILKIVVNPLKYLHIDEDSESIKHIIITKGNCFLNNTSMNINQYTMIPINMMTIVENKCSIESIELLIIYIGNIFN